MNPTICVRVADAMCTAVRKEVDFLRSNKVLDQHQSESRSAYVLARIFQEHTLRYITLREFYVSEQNRGVKFSTESNGTDLVLYRNGRKYAFEMKIWLAGIDEHEIKDMDIQRLKDFQKREKNSSCYELVFSAPFGWGKEPKERFEKEFVDTFREDLKLLYCEPIYYGDFACCVYLARLDTSTGKATRIRSGA